MSNWKCSHCFRLVQKCACFFFLVGFIRKNQVDLPFFALALYLTLTLGVHHPHNFFPKLTRLPLFNQITNQLVKIVWNRFVWRCWRFVHRQLRLFTQCIYAKLWIMLWKSVTHQIVKCYLNHFHPENTQNVICLERKNFAVTFYDAIKIRVRIRHAH